MDFQVGDKIDGQFEVIGKHVGGMGIVYITVDDFSGRKYAVKSIKEELLKDPNTLRRFSMEARTWINLDRHDNIVQAMFYREVEGKPLLFLEFIEGTDLQHLLRKDSPLAVPQAIDFALQFCKGMEYVHNKEVAPGQRGLIHRDIKPGNIMVTKQRQVRITDFGLVRVADSATRLTQDGAGLGTPLYMPPEQIQDAHSVDKRADIYSFGAVFYEMLTGRPPLQADNLGSLVLKILTEQPPPPSAFNARVPPALDTIVMKCLEKDRGRRFNSFAEIAAALAPLYEPSLRALGPTARRCQQCGYLTEKELGECPLCEGNLEPFRFEAEMTQAIPALEVPLTSTIAEATMAGVSSSEVAVVEVQPTPREGVGLEPDITPIPTPSGIHELQVALGHEHLQRGDLQAAEQAYRAALRLKPDLTVAHFNLGVIYFQQGRITEAEAAFQEALRCNPRYEKARLALERLRLSTPTGAGLAEAKKELQIVHEKDGSIMVLVPAGEFIMGSNEHDRSERPQRKVYLDAYYIDIYCITNSQFARFVEETGYKTLSPWRRYFKPGRENHPVIYVSWQDAVAYCEWAGKRLPTEAEWEKAARGTDGRLFPWGNEFDLSRLNIAESGYGTTVPVDAYPQGVSPYGCYNMAGNVWEWCADWFDPTYYIHAPQQNPKGPESGRFRVLRGGDFNTYSYEGQFRCSARGSPDPEKRMSYVRGFRCAKDAP